MDIDPLESANSAAEDAAVAHTASISRLGSQVAITVALLATFLGVCKVKDDNLVQAMQQAQADKLDHWNFYQARNIREEIARATLTQLELAATGGTAAQQEKYRAAVAAYQRLVAEQALKKEELRKQAEDDQRTDDALNYRDDQFDLSDALIAIAISMLAVSVLTHKRWMYGLALVPTFAGVVMGLAGLLGWRLHSDVLARWLS